jgi:hypothetical protein
VSHRCVVVLGMHRSGTSAVARGLQALGVELGDRLIPGDDDNPSGYWEDLDLLTINERLLRALGLRWDSVTLIESSRWESPAVQALITDAAEVVRNRFGASPLWGFKDPRTTRVLPFWQEVLARLGVEARYVVVIRNPLSVAASLRDRDGIAPERSGLLWLAYMVPHLSRIRQSGFVVIDYDALMADPNGQLTRAAAGLGLDAGARGEDGLQDYATQFLARSLRHTQFTERDLESDPHMGPLVRDAFRWLRRLALGEIPAQAPALWEDWRRLQEILSTQAPVWRYLDELEGQAEALRARTAALHSQLTRLRSSTSWRITRPLRAMRWVVRRAPESDALGEAAGGSPG